MQNWKPKLFGVLAILLTSAGPVLEAYYPLRGLNWIVLMGSLAGAAAGAGLLTTKSYDTHSTVDQVHAATDKAEVKALTNPDIEKKEKPLP